MKRSTTQGVLPVTEPVLFPEMERDNWYTPDWLFEILCEEYGPFTLDVAASAKNAKCGEYFNRRRRCKQCALEAM